MKPKVGGKRWRSFIFLWLLFIYFIFLPAYYTPLLPSGNTELQTVDSNTCIHKCYFHMSIHMYVYVSVHTKLQVGQAGKLVRDLTTVCRGVGMWTCECTLCFCGWHYENRRELWGWELWGRLCWDFLLPKTWFRMSSTHMRTATRSCLIYTTTNSQTQAYKVQHTLSIAATATLFGKHWHYHLLPVTAKPTLFLQHKVHYQIVCSQLNNKMDAKVKWNVTSIVTKQSNNSDCYTRMWET